MLENSENIESIEELSFEDISSYEYAPIMSCDVKRSFFNYENSINLCNMTIVKVTSLKS